MASRNLHILVIDDSLAILAHVQEVLELEGHRVETAPGPKEGLAALTKTMPDIILMDVEMPNMDGYQLCTYIRKHPEWEYLPVIFLSGRRDEASILQGFASGGNDYVTKPFSKRELIARLEAHGFKALIEKELAAKTKALRDLAAQQERIIQDRTKALQQSQEAMAETLATLARERTYQSELVNSRKLESLGSLVADVAHQVNTPLGNSITTTSFLLTRNRQMEDLHKEGNLTKTGFDSFLEDTRNGLGLLEASLEKVRTTMDRFKLIAINQYEDRPATFELHTVMDLVMARFAGRLEKAGIEFRHTGGNGPVVEGFPAAISMIMENLIGNVLDHAFREGKRGVISIESTFDDKKVHICVTDDGCGMDQETQDRMWDPFFTTRRDEGFMGLGLFVVHNLVTGKLNGKVRCASAPGAGSTICVEFPTIVAK